MKILDRLRRKKRSNSIKVVRLEAKENLELLFPVESIEKLFEMPAANEFSAPSSCSTTIGYLGAERPSINNGMCTHRFHVHYIEASHPPSSVDITNLSNKV